MQFYKSDLLKYISGSISDTDLIEKLTELGLEVDQSKKEKNDLNEGVGTNGTVEESLVDSESKKPQIEEKEGRPAQLRPHGAPRPFDTKGVYARVDLVNTIYENRYVIRRLCG